MKHDPTAFELPSRYASEDGPPASLRAKVLATIAETPAPNIPLRRRLLLALLALPAITALVLAGGALFFRRRPLRLDLDQLPRVPLVAELAMFGILVTVATLIAVRPGRHGLGSAARALLSTALTVAPVYALLSLSLPLECATTEAASRRLNPWGLPCLTVAALIGMLALGVLIWSLRHAAPVAPRLRGAALGAASGAWAGASLVVHCPSISPVHLLVGHVVPVMVFTVLGALAAPPFLRP